MKVCVGARKSQLSRAQVAEVLSELKHYHSQVVFDSIYLETTGDRDRSTSLRDLEKTDFFTKEIDDLLINGGCRIGIHSAKDLPDPIRKGLIVAAITKGVDPSDALVMREGETLLVNPVIATSSIRREELVQNCLGPCRFVDIRGTIEERICKLKTGDVDGVVVAEAALIRLGLTHLNCILLDGKTVPYQGQLAVLCQEGDEEMRALFSCLDSR